MKRSLLVLFTILSLISFTFFWPVAAQAAGSSPTLSVSTTYPSEVVQLGESVSFTLALQATDVAQTVDMSMQQIPEGWTATFRGGSHIIESVYVGANSSGSVDLRLDPPAGEKPGTYTFIVLAQSETFRVSNPESRIAFAFFSFSSVPLVKSWIVNPNDFNTTIISISFG